MGCCGGGSVQQPDYAAASTQAVYTDMSTLPFKDLIDAAAQMGSKITLDGKTYDFSGLGTADNAKVVGNQMAQALVKMQSDYGPQYVAQRIKELQESDPQGFQARKDLYSGILDQMGKIPAASPVAGQLYDREVADLSKGAALDPELRRQVQQKVRGTQAARGNVLGNAAASQEAGAVESTGEAVRSQRQQDASSLLSSGVTPEDVQYRQLQQSLANLSAFTSGTTPTAQFAQLSSAGNAAAPWMSNWQAQQTDPNAGTRGASNAASVYNTQVGYQMTQANPWLAGLQTGINTMGTMSHLGWNPGKGI